VPPQLLAAAPQPLAENPFLSSSSPVNPFAGQPHAISPRPVAPDAWTTEEDAPFQPIPARGAWLERAGAALDVPVRALTAAIARVGVDRSLLTRRTRRTWKQMRSELALLALRAHGVVVHRTRGRLGAIVLATAPVLLLSAAAGLWFSNRKPPVTTQATVEAVPTDAEIARILRSRTGFTVTTEPAGARINVDGRATGRVTPERVSGFAAGLHSIELKKAGYYDTNLAAVLEEGSTLVLPPVILRALPAEHIDPEEQ
jgi:hypothetical protein